MFWNDEADMCQPRRSLSYAEAIAGMSSAADVDAEEGSKFESSPYDKANTWGRISYGFVIDLLRLGYSRPLQVRLASARLSRAVMSIY